MVVDCKNCEKPYKIAFSKLLPAIEVGENRCPYCNFVNDISYEYKFVCFPIPFVENGLYEKLQADYYASLELENEEEA